MPPATLNAIVAVIVRTPAMKLKSTPVPLAASKMANMKENNPAYINGIRSG